MCSIRKPFIMTNEEVVARMWEAYKAGMRFSPDAIKNWDTLEPLARKSFDNWLVDPEHFPELLEENLKKKKRENDSSLVIDISEVMRCMKEHTTTFGGYTRYVVGDLCTRGIIGIFISENWMASSEFEDTCENFSRT